MRGGRDPNRATPASLVPTAVVAAAVLVLALVVSGGSEGTIVVQRFVERVGSASNRTAQRLGITTVTETSPDGRLERIGFASSLAGGLRLLISGSLQERYLPRDRTIYVMTGTAFDAAYARYMQARFGQRVRLPPAFAYADSWLAPGRESFFKRQLDSGNYRVAGRTRIDGRRALKLVPAPGRDSIAFALHSHDRTMLQTAYVSPGSYAPIEEGQPGSEATVWTEYRVLPATAANERRLLSLTAQHPRARISHSAIAFMRAASGS